MAITIIPGLPALYKATSAEQAREVLELSVENVSPLYKLTQSATSGGMWGPRDGARLYFLDGDLFLVGGWAGSPYDTNWALDTASTCNQVYKSIDLGETWTRIRSQDTSPDATHFTPRHWFAGFVYNSFMWMVNGDTGLPNNGPINSDVRYSSNGVDWTKVNSVSPGYHGKWGVSAGVLNGYMYVVGGQELASSPWNTTNKVWRSANNGVDWIDMSLAPHNQTPSWTPRGMAGDLVEFNGHLWLIAGGVYDDVNGNRTYLNDVHKYDGTTWTEVLANGHDQFPAVFWPSVFVYNGWLYCSRGYATNTNSDETYRSLDGIYWEKTDWVLQASHADAVTPTDSGVAVAVGNWTLGGLPPLNTDSPTYFFSATDSSVSAIVNYVNDRVDTAFADVPTSYVFSPAAGYVDIRMGSAGAAFADRVYIGDYLIADDGQCLVGQDGSNYYICSGFTTNTKVIRIGSSTNTVNLLDGLRLSNASGGYVFNTSNLDRTTISATGTLLHNSGSTAFLGSFYSNAATNYFRLSNINTAGVLYFALGENATDGSTPFWILRYGSTHATKASEIEIINYNTAPMTLGTNNVSQLKFNSSIGSTVEFLRAMKPYQSTDGGVQNDSFYYSTTASSMAYKDSGGTVHAIQRTQSVTTASLEAVGNSINTVDKYAGKQVWNSTTGRPVWAFGSTAGSVWVDQAGATLHTPV